MVKRLYPFLLSAIALLAFFPAHAPTVLADEKKEIIALVPAHWPPQYLTDDEGRSSGFAIDVMNEIARLGNLKVTYKKFPSFSATVDALKNGEGDLIPNSGILSDRFDAFIFTSPVETFYLRVLVRNDETRITGFNDLTGKTVAVVEKNVGLFRLKDRNDLRIRVERDLQDAMFSLISGNADALLYPGSVALSLAREAKIDDRIKVVGYPVEEIKRGIRLRVGQERLRDELEPLVQQFVKSEAYQNIYAKWYGGPPPLLSNTQLWYLLIGSVVLVSLALLGWRQLSLRNLNRELERKNKINTEALERGKKLLEATGKIAKLGGWELDVLTGNVTWTEQVYAIYGLQPGDQPITAEEALSYYPDDARSKLEAGIERAIRYGEPYDIETEFLPKTGGTLWVRATCQPKSEGGEVTQLYGTFQDITDQKQSQLEIIKSKERAEALVREKETLIQEVHHRVKNNLQVILSMLSLQKRASKGDHERFALNESARRVRVLAKLYEHLYQSDNVAEIKASDYLGDVVADGLEAAVSEQQIEIELKCDETIVLDTKTATACAQIVSELISNCVKHAFPEGAGKIELSLQRLSNGGNKLTVRDDGVGLPEGFDEKKLKSMGIKLINALVMQIGGKKEIRNDGGTVVEVVFGETKND